MKRVSTVVNKLLAYSFIVFALPGAETIFAASPQITDWSSDGSGRENDRDSMYLVNPGESLTFTVMVDQPVEYDWQVNKVDQETHDRTFTWVVPGEKGIWEIHLKVTGDEGEAHQEWVISTLHKDEAPDFFDSFTDGRWKERSDTDPWGRKLPEWKKGRDPGIIKATSRFLEPDLDQGRPYSDRRSGKGLVTMADLSTFSPTAFGTWKIRYRFTKGYVATPLTDFEYTFIKSGDNRFLYNNASDTHEHFQAPRIGNYTIDPSYDSGTYDDSNWHEEVMVRPKEGNSYIYKDGMLEWVFNDKTIKSSTEIAFYLEGYLRQTGPPEILGRDAIYLDNIEIYKDKYLFPPEKIRYGKYISNYRFTSETKRDHVPLWKEGIIVEGRGVTLQDIARGIHDPSLFSYDEAKKEARCYTNLAIEEGAELIIKNEKLIFVAQSDGGLEFVPNYGSTLKIINSTVTTADEHYFVWNFASSTTHFSYNISGVYFHPSGSPASSQGIRRKPQGMGIWWGSVASFIVENSTIDNSAHLFLDAPYEVKIIHSRITNLRPVDIGNYYSGPYQKAMQTQRAYAKGKKSFYFFQKNFDMLDFEMRGIKFQGEQSPIDITFLINDDRARFNIYDIDAEKENLRIRKSVSMYCSNIEKYWPKYYEGSLGLVNSRFKRLILQPEPAYSGSSLDAKGIKLIPKYYLDVQVVDTQNKPVKGATVTVVNEVNHDDYPPENMIEERNLIKTIYGWRAEWYSTYRIVHYAPLFSTRTGNDGHTPLPAEGENTLVLADYVLSSEGKKEFTYTIRASYQGVRDSVKVNPNPTWYREHPNSYPGVSEKGTITITLPVEGAVGVKEEGADRLPRTYALGQNSPNPFNLTTQIHYALPRPSPVRLVLYNILGERVKTLLDTPQEPGYYTIRWDGKDAEGKEVASGVYFYQMSAGEYTAAKKLLMLR